MITDKIKALETVKAEAAALEASVAADLPSELAALPAKYGFATAKDLAEQS
jgi:hypothetical protein